MSTKLEFVILSTDNCNTFALADTSYYNPNQPISNAALQIISPFSTFPVQVNYYRSGITVINSASLNITNPYDPLQVIPDGIYTAKISICPEDKYFYEKTWFRTCQLECQYEKALLKLDITKCDECFDPKKLDKLKRANIYIQGVKANMGSCNIKQAQALYTAANKIIEDVIDCNC
jgi:hypothetical protein